MSERFKRQSFLGAQSDDVFAEVRVGIVGLGGGGSHINQQLAHLGVRRVLLCDPQLPDESNLNRTVGLTPLDVADGVPKVEVAARLARGIRAESLVVPTQAKWQTLVAALRSCDVIFGAVDTFEGRAELEGFARRSLIPYIDIGMDVHELGARFLIAGQTFASVPGGPCLRCIGIVSEATLKREVEQYGAGGGNPQVIWANGILASMAVGLFVQLVCPWHNRVPFPCCLDYDGNRHSVEVSPRLKHLTRDCPHFPPDGVGDPLFARSSTV